MLGAAGCIAPEILATAGVIPQTPAEVTWFRSGVIPPAGVYSKCARSHGSLAVPCSCAVLAELLYIYCSACLSDVSIKG
jgi:hypothetical protein